MKAIRSSVCVRARVFMRQNAPEIDEQSFRILVFIE